MSTEVYKFEGFRLDAANRQLERQGTRIELNSRYLDVLILLVREQGNLIAKQRFIDDAWSGVPVTDEALTQAIRTIRRQLGDDATKPQFIETIPKHGYRFIAPVEEVAGTAPARAAASVGTNQDSHFLLWRAGTLGGIIAGVLGGVIYGLAEASGPLTGGAAGISVVLVYVCMTATVAFLGGAGVAFGIVAAARMQPRNPLAMVIGGAVGGLVIGAVVKLIGTDAFLLLFGKAPADMTGAFEGLLLGAAIGLAVAITFGHGSVSIRRAALVGCLTTGLAGALIPLLGGQMLGGSLELLTLSFPNSQLRFGHNGLFFGENGFGPVAQVVTGALEGILFGGSTVAAMALAKDGDKLKPESLFADASLGAPRRSR
ncbi:winged helix-turn-helix domain-containing protein [Devosia sp. RR2S18]|uniref:winged helix-turn-helix domain-containing protein n=1 Tax=Devosia rhizosphaerae TaxID=3049774 RepID=UPI0025400B59|nr:winged helix-turn-helix domain-containing protein [Devosia sp. RR2S18]WIJ26946.1 winged helix-turn-helix domain-containing protein [Devosia sp. RR2S18]